MSTLQWHTEPMVLRIARAISQYIGFGNDDSPDPSPQPVKPKEKPVQEQPQPALRLMPDPETQAQHPSHKWRRHEALRSYESPLPSVVRDGRHEAVRGLFAARSGALDVAMQHFTLAAQCEDVDITAVPGFWKLTRGQMQTAVDAYEATGRYRDAAALDAHIATIFRPSLVGASRQPIVPQRAEHKAVSN